MGCEKNKKLKDDFRFTAANIWKCLLHAKSVILRGECNDDYQPHFRNVSRTYAFHLYNRWPFSKDNMS